MTRVVMTRVVTQSRPWQFKVSLAATATAVAQVHDLIYHHELHYMLKYTRTDQRACVSNGQPSFSSACEVQSNGYAASWLAPWLFRLGEGHRCVRT